MANHHQSSGALPLQPPAVGSMGPQGFGPPLPLQFHPAVPALQGQPFSPMASQQFRPLGPSSHGIPAGQIHPLQFPPTMQQLAQRSSQPGLASPLPQSIPLSYMQQNMPPAAGSSQTHMPGLAGPGLPLSSSYTFAPSPHGQPQINVNASTFRPVSQLQVPFGGQPWLGGQSSVPVNPVQQTVQQSSVSAITAPAVNGPSQALQSSFEWQEHTSADGRRYFYNKKTKQSSWEKPLELMSPLERADASTPWKEFTTPEGKKYYYNKTTKQSKWTIPEELKLAREQIGKTVSQGTQPDADPPSHATPPSSAVGTVELPNASISTNSTSTIPRIAPIPLPVTPVVSVETALVVGSGSSSISVDPAVPGAGEVHSSAVTDAPPTQPHITLPNLDTTLTGGPDNASSQDVENSLSGTSVLDIEDAKKRMAVAGKVNVTPVEEKTLNDEAFVYASKQEAKKAFKELLKSANVESDWIWEQAMRVIINDKRYGALKTLGERKQVFHEYLGQKKKLDAEERRIRQKKAREEFTKMLEESQEITSFTKWRHAKEILENDERFNAVERHGEREDLFENYMVELQQKEKAKSEEERKQNFKEFRQYLETCDFIKANSQWRKVQDRLEGDERCLRLEKIDRLLVFQDYLRDLEKEEEEERKLQKEELRRAERRNRDEFRKLMEEHVVAGTLSAKTQWRDYCIKVKDSPVYVAVSSNTGGSTPNDLFEDITEELEKKYQEEKTRIKDAIKLGKVTMMSTLPFEDFKTAIVEDVGTPTISDVNFKLVFDELVERAKEKEEKEAKKRQRLADDFSRVLRSKVINASSTWEDCIPLLEGTQEYRSIADESIRREIFDEYSTYLKEKAKEKERKREEEKAKREREREEKEKRKEKEREREREREKERERSRKDETDSENADVGVKENKRRENDRDRKHRKRHQSDDISSDRDEKEDSKKSHRHGSDHKKSRKHTYSPESDSENRHKRHRRDHQDSSHQNGVHEELEDGELGEDGEIR